eukprot:g22786.t1
MYCRQSLVGSSCQTLILAKEKSILRNFWLLLIITAILSSSLSFVIDRFTFAVGLLRSALTLGAPCLGEGRRPP